MRGLSLCWWFLGGEGGGAAGLLSVVLRLAPREGDGGGASTDGPGMSGEEAGGGEVVSLRWVMST